jgi:hypothetical protein
MIRILAQKKQNFDFFRRKKNKTIFKPPLILFSPKPQIDPESDPYVIYRIFVSFLCIFNADTLNVLHFSHTLRICGK